MSEGLKQKIQSLLVEIENLRRHNHFDADTDNWQVPQRQLLATEKQTKDVLGLLDEATKQIREKLDKILIQSAIGALVETLDSRSEWKKGYTVGFANATQKINEEVLSVLVGGEKK